MAGKKGNARQTSLFFLYNQDEFDQMKKVLTDGIKVKDFCKMFGCSHTSVPKLRRILGLPQAQRNPIRSVYEIRDFATGEVLHPPIKGLKNLADICCRNHLTIAKHLGGKAKSTSYKGRKVIIKKIS